MRVYITSLLKINNLIRQSTSTRFYPRWTHRKPIKILSEEEFELQEQFYQNNSNKTNNIIELDPSHVKGFNEASSAITTKQNRKQKPKKNDLLDLEKLDAETHFKQYEQKDIKKPEKKKVQYTKESVSSTTFDEDGNFIYTKMKDNDPRIASLMLMVKSKKLRKRKEVILLEGKRLIKDALQTGCTMQHLLFSRKNSVDFLRDFLPKKDVQLYKMAYRDMQMWSDLTTCPGIIGIFKTPNIENIIPSEESLPLSVICDNIREPGNLGAILRSCVAAGCQKIILTKGCVDMWDTKVLRSSAGAHFRLPIHNNLEWENISDLIPSHDALFLADNNVINTNMSVKENIQNMCLQVPVIPYYSVQFSNYKSMVLVIGGETFGLSENAYKFACESNGVRVNIPLENNIDSLNSGTALGIIIFELKRQLLLSK